MEDEMLTAKHAYNGTVLAVDRRFSPNSLDESVVRTLERAKAKRDKAKAIYEAEAQKVRDIYADIMGARQKAAAQREAERQARACAERRASYEAAVDRLRQLYGLCE